MFSILNSYDYKNQFTTRKVEIPFLGEYESLDKFKFIYIYAFTSSIDDILTVQFSNKQNDIQYEFNTDRYEIKQNEPLEIIIPKRLNFFRVNITNNSLFNRNIRRVYSVYLFDSQYIKTSIVKDPSGSWLVGIDTNVISSVLPDGAATSELQTSTQNILSSRIPVKGPAGMTGSSPVTIATDQPAILVNGSGVTQPISGSIIILNGTNNNRRNGVLYNAAVITQYSSSATIDLYELGSEMYNSITVSGISSSELYSMVLEYSNDNSTFYTDHIEPNVKKKGIEDFYEFSFTRTNINHRYVRVYNLTGTASLDLIYSITRN